MNVSPIDIHDVGMGKNLNKLLRSNNNSQKYCVICTCRICISPTDFWDMYEYDDISHVLYLKFSLLEFILWISISYHNVGFSNRVYVHLN